MSKALALLCSPRAGGVTDQLATEFVRGYENLISGFEIRALRDAPIVACDNCGQCSLRPETCKYDPDWATSLFEQIFAARLLLIAAPIYFYNVPARFKAFIDRGQKYWPERRRALDSPQAILIMAAARSGGENLFNCARLTISYFLRCLGVSILETRAYGDLENPASITPELRKSLREFGENIARAIRDR